MERVWRPGRPLDLIRTLAPVSRTPTQVVASDSSLWRATLTPDGPASLRLTKGAQDVTGEAWGPGAAWVLDGFPDLLGARDDVDPELDHPLLIRTQRAHSGVRIPRTGRVLESLVPAILEQKVTGKQARQSFVSLVRRYGEPAPGPAPAGLRVPPTAQVWGAIPSWEWHQAGVDPRRMRTVMAVAQVAPRLEETVAMGRDDAYRRLTAVPGVGEWTAAEVALGALGDTDAVSVGDFHLSQLVGWALVGRPLDDANMLELLEKWRPLRAKVIRLIELSGVSKPKFGPRLTIQDHRQH